MTLISVLRKKDLIGAEFQENGFATETHFKFPQHIPGNESRIKDLIPMPDSKTMWPFNDGSLLQTAKTS